MTPVYDADTRLVAFFDGQHVFAAGSLEWLAFHSRGDVFAAASGHWLGPFHEGSFLDRAGRPVAWLVGATPAARLGAAAPLALQRPLPPKRPLHPRAPLAPRRPLVPVDGWSALSWDQWLGRPAPPAPVDLAVPPVEASAPAPAAAASPALAKEDLRAFLRTQKWAVEASVSTEGGAQAALIGIAVTDDLELVFDTIESSRKAVNLKQNPRVAFVVGGWAPGDERTLQVDAVADFPQGEELERLKAAYYAAFPDGPSRLSWPGLVYVRARPVWARLSDFTVVPPIIREAAF
jgi:hypothetical protein